MIAALAVLATIWLVAGLLCLAEAQPPAAVAARVLEMPSDVLVPVAV